MKIRTSFVSNSSSSSFMCKVCGEMESGWDLTLTQAHMSECEECGRTIHKECMNKVDDEKAKELWIKFFRKTFQDQIEYNKEEKESNNKYYREGALEEAQQQLETFEEFIKEGNPDWTDIFDEYQDWSDSQMPKEFCPFCSLTKISTDKTLNYLLQKYDLKLEDVEQEIRDKKWNTSG